MRAALQMADELNTFNITSGLPPLSLKIGLHCGPCIVVNSNQRLDYFGRTVNLAARLGNESFGGDIVVSEAMASEPEVAAALDRLMPSAETAIVKGFDEPVRLCRIAPPG